MIKCYLTAFVNCILVLNYVNSTGMLAFISVFLKSDAIFDERFLLVYHYVLSVNIDFFPPKKYTFDSDIMELKERLMEIVFFSKTELK